MALDLLLHPKASLENRDNLAAPDSAPHGDPSCSIATTLAATTRPILSSEIRCW
ncbi:hypothetical protein HAX54_011425, partial [Datura stramonium]|nr:hypothetical protein [Datura stramonium]